ncbi:MAG: alcohol dehydrogenase catalytic domain-containing protein [Acidobacteriota bacterium]
MKMRAAVLEEFGKPLVIRELDLEPPREGEVLVKIQACGVCHTDYYTASGADPGGYVPCVLGHEGAGRVEVVGKGVTLVRPGDQVITLFAPECGKCVHCASGRTNLCLAIRDQQGRGYLPDGTSRLSLGSDPIRHFMGTSTFAEYTVMPEIALAKVRREAPADRICLLACGFTTGLAAALSRAEVREGSSCGIFGAGLVGLGAVAGCRMQGAGRIVVVDPSAERREFASRYGATDLLDGGPDVVKQILDMTDGFGLDYTFEATGIVEVMGQAVEAARMGWGLCTILGVAAKGKKLEIVPRLLITGRRVIGGSFGGARGRSQVPGFVDLYLDGKLDLDSLVSHHLKLEDVNRGFELMEKQDGLRSVIQF